MNKSLNIVLTFITIGFLSSCSFLKNSWNDLNLFPVTQDIELGKQVSAEIEANPAEYPILKQAGNESLYAYLNDITKKILATNLVDYSRDFAWKISIINDPKTLNAFCTPGGYIYVYTGLISYLDSEDQLAGVIGHEMAHAANRHSTKQLSKSLGLQILLDAALGKQEVIKQVSTALISLNFSRANETQADSFSVKYLCPTQWNSMGSAGFFRKIEGQATPPQWLSTHPSPVNRVKAIETKAKELNCKGKETNTSKYAQIKDLISKLPAPPPKPPKSNPDNKAPTLPTSSPSQSKTGDKPAPSSTGKTPEKKILKKGG